MGAIGEVVSDQANSPVFLCFVMIRRGEDLEESKSVFSGYW
jgi:hypothetical protein